MTTTTTEHGTYEHGKPYLGDLTWFRTDSWTSNKGTAREHERLFAAGPKDDSPIYRGRYDAECSCCYLGFAHTTEAHEQRVKR